MTAIRERPPIDLQATNSTRRRYERLSAYYDRLEGLTEQRYRPWRQKLWHDFAYAKSVRGPRTLEVGVGTGKDIPYWPDHLAMTAIDLTPGMLALARRQADQLGLHPDLRVGDVQALDFPDASFDSAVAWLISTGARSSPATCLRGLNNVPLPAVPQPTDPDPQGRACNSGSPMQRVRLPIQRNARHDIPGEAQRACPNVDDDWPVAGRGFHAFSIGS